MRKNYQEFENKNTKIEIYSYQKDIKHHLINKQDTMILNISSGYGFNIPFTNVVSNYEYSALRCKYEFGDCILTTSFENKNPYTHMGKKGWDIYLDEWIVRYFSHEDFLKGNRISKVEENVHDEDFLKQFDLITFSYVIDDAKEITHPYYQIAIIREKENYADFYLMVMKSKTNRVEIFKQILSSFVLLNIKGEASNVLTTYPICQDINWNEMTKKYFNKLLNQDHIDWGIFLKSIVSEEDGYYPACNEFYEQNAKKYDQLMNHQFELFPTYMHISWNNKLNRFPLTMALKYAGGDGFNGKKVLHFTFQYTANNNSSLFGYSPSFDILRGEFDEFFHQLAKDIKAYHYPVLFRLNNEMNTDWTSYSGIASLLDPDIFILTWKRLFDIFKEEKVDNCIWIFNPFDISTPFSCWGEYLCYYPKNMVHMLGLTAYERGNGETLKSFAFLYERLYQKNSPYFDLFPQIISEFGAGAGGDVLYDYDVTHKYVFLKRTRNLPQQTKWVQEMFQAIYRKEPYLKNIKAAIWFSCNDYAYVNNQNYIMNYFQLSDEVMPTILAFKEGFNKNDKL